MNRAPGSGIGILGMAGALPSTIRTNDFWGDEFRRQYDERAKRDITTAATQSAPDDIDPEVIDASAATRADVFKGTHQRRVLDPALSASDLEVAAGRAALSAADVDPSEIDLFILYSLLPDDVIPLTHARVATRLGLRSDVIAFSLASACGSWPLHLHTAAHLMRDSGRKALCIQSSLMSRIQDYEMPNSVNGGDAAMATVLGPVRPGRGYVHYKQHTKGALGAGVRAVSRTEPNTPWYAADRLTSPLTAQTDDAKAVRNMGGRAATYCRETCGALLEESGRATADVDWFVLSQPTAWFRDACCRAMGIPVERSLDTFAEYGHIMAASAPMNLMTAQRAGMLSDDDLVMLYSPGAGFVQSALLLRWTECETALVEVSP